jgi:hypothetical protein
MLSFDKNYIGLIALLLSFSIVVTLIWNFIFNKPFRKLRYKNDFFSLKGTHSKELTQRNSLKVPQSSHPVRPSPQCQLKLRPAKGNPDV